MAIALYPGTFDPITNGHCDLVRRALKLFDKVVVAVAANPSKAPLFDLDTRCDLARQSLADVDGAEVCGFTGLTVQFARERGIGVILRGLRAVSDFEFEFQLAAMNRHLSPEVETLFLTPSERYTFLSSSMVREVAGLKGGVSQFVHPAVEAALKARFG
ncbi:MAG TPA: pantetheine-phosphate adenylyltransferase [Gammaproteobacteria bacterium]|nr:pantetheine-phosphate adenylyltransferase [Gammaproteobacteria bacterium]